MLLVVVFTIEVKHDLEPNGKFLDMKFKLYVEEQYTLTYENLINEVMIHCELNHVQSDFLRTVTFNIL